MKPMYPTRDPNSPVRWSLVWDSKPRSQCHAMHIGGIRPTGVRRTAARLAPTCMKARYGAISEMIQSMPQENFALVSRRKPSEEMPGLERKISKQNSYLCLLMRSLIPMEGLEVAVLGRSTREKSLPCRRHGPDRRTRKQRENARTYGACVGKYAAGIDSRRGTFINRRSRRGLSVRERIYEPKRPSLGKEECHESLPKVRLISRVRHDIQYDIVVCYGSITKHTNLCANVVRAWQGDRE